MSRALFHPEVSMYRSFALALVVASSSPSWAKPAPPADQIRIDSVEYHGDGCTPGTALASISPDAQAFTVGFSRFEADAGGGATGPRSVRCDLHLQVTIPPGWSYALERVDYIGYAALDPGVSAWRRSTWHLSGEAPEQALASTFAPGFSGDYAVDAAAAALYWSRCGKGKNVVIATQLGIDDSANPGGAGTITVDAVDGEVYRLVWRQCR